MRNLVHVTLDDMGIEVGKLLSLNLGNILCSNTRSCFILILDVEVGKADELARRSKILEECVQRSFGGSLSCGILAVDEVQFRIDAVDFGTVLVPNANPVLKALKSLLVFEACLADEELQLRSITAMLFEVGFCHT